jgi:hypothetical protein
MIIVRTKNSDKFINDKMMTKAELNKEKAEFECHVEGALLHYNEVETIIYTNGTKSEVWKNESSERERMIAELNELRDKKNFYFTFCNDYRALQRKETDYLSKIDYLLKKNEKLKSRLSKRTIWQILRLKPIKQ